LQEFAIASLIYHSSAYFCFMMIDLRSDTFTKPTPPMLAAMMNAAVGDDVFGEDPTVNTLEAATAQLFGMEAALFCPSGTMTNQIGIKCHTQPGQEVICDKTSHVYIYEGGGIAFNSGCQVKPLKGLLGKITAEQVKAAINPDDIHKAPTALVCLENTVNRGGGGTYEFADFHSVKEVCINNNIKLHLDGARIFNAIVANKEDPMAYGKIFDSISVCLSKGLGAPIGSLLLGNAEYIKKARRVRKVLGGGMRQAGYMAAAGLYALENHIQRLELDHIHAKQIAHALIRKNFVGHMLPVETNIVIFEISHSFTPIEFCDFMKKRGVYCLPISDTQVRMVTHLDVHQHQVKDMLDLIESM
jgi:threonine aldolase